MNDTLKDDLLKGARAIGDYIGEPNEGKVFYYLRKGFIPGFKIGTLWCSRKSEINRKLSAQGGEAA